MSRPRAARIWWALLAPGAAALFAGAAGARDCDHNGVEDSIDVESGTSADCNGNGIPDACDVDPAGRTLGEPARTVVLRFNAQRAAVADLQGDGYPDVVLAGDFGREGRVLLGTGSGTFTPGSDFGINGPGASSLVAAELTGDDWPDLALLSRAPNNRDLLAVFVNRGDGSLDAPEEAFVVGGPSLLAAGDVDGDRDVDLLVTESDQDLSFFINDGMGSFYSVGRVELSGRGFSSLLVADLDGDGDLDAALSSPSRGAVLVLRNDGSGDFRESEVLQAAGHEPFYLAAADLEGDGDLDLFSLETSPGESFHVFRSAGGAFAPVAGSRAGPDPRSFAARDVDGDGLADLASLHGFYACSSAYGEVRLRRGKGDGTFLSPLIRKVDGYAWDLRTADFDADQDVDVMALSSGGLPDFLWVFPSQPGPASADVNANEVPDECELGAADCNGNGVLDATDIATGASSDCDANEIPDACEPDCNRNGLADDCDLASGASGDQDANGIPDECQSRAGDCNENGWPDAVEITNGQDCDGNGILDSCDVAPVIRFSERLLSRHLLPGPPGRAASADLDLDGDLDAAVTTRAACCPATSGSLSVFLNHGDGTFAPAGSYAADGDPDAVAAADINSDGAPDLVLAARSLACREGRLVRAFINRGAGSFRRGGSFSLPWEPRGLEAEDFDGDGDIDLAVGNDAPLAKSVSIYRNEDLGRFVAGGSFGPAAGALAIESGDWNQDGHPDIAAAGSNPGGLWVLLGASFERTIAVQEPAPPGSIRPATIASGDLDGDGDPDLVAGEIDPLSLSPPLVTIHGNAGDGTFPASTSEQVPARPDGFILWERDGRQEVFVVGPLAEYLDGAVYITLFRGEAKPGLGEAGGFVVGPSGSSASLGGSHRDRELLVLDAATNSLLVLRAAGTDLLAARQRYPLDNQAIDIRAVDLDGDGRQDLVTADSDTGTVFILRNSSSATRVEPSFVPVTWSAGVPSEPRSIAAGDIDGDGDADLAIAAAFHVGFFWNQGEARFSAGGTQLIGSNPVRVLLVDLDRDGDLDLTTANSLREAGDNASVALNDGSGSFGPSRNYAAGRGPVEFIAADLDGDGAPDLITLNATSADASVLWNSGNGTFVQGASVPLDGVSALAAFDADADGDGDLIASHYLTLGILRNDGQRLFAEEHLADSHRSYAHLLAVDLDGDADLDLLGATRQVLAAFRNRGEGAFEGPFSFEHRTGIPVPPRPDGSGGSNPNPPPSPAGPMSIAASDLDGDGDPDVAVGFPDHAGFLLNHTVRAQVDRNADQVPDVCQASPDTSFRRADSTADGKIDLTDAIRILWHLFLGGDDLPCAKAADTDDTGRLDLADPVRILRFLFLGESPPPPPFPGCDLDPTPDLLDCARSLGC